MNTLALLLLLTSGGLRSTTLCTGSNPRDCLPPPAVCGDGIVHRLEVCDDGNRVDNDGCSMDCKRSSVVAARYRFDRTGTLDLPAGMPQPTFDCRLDKWSGTGNLVCDGTSPVTFTPYNGPTAGVPTYWRPGGGSTAGAGIGFDGVDDYFDGGNVDAPSGSFTIIWSGTTNSLAASINPILVKDDGYGTRRSFVFRRNTNAIELVVFNSSQSPSVFIVPASLTLGTTTAACVVYDRANGVMRGNVNGIVPAELTGAVDMANSAAPLRIGAYSSPVASSYFPGMTSDLMLVPAAYSAAQCAAVVNSMTGKRGTNNEALTVTRANAQSVVLKNSDAEPFVTNVPANQLAIGQNGAEIYGPYTQALPYSEAFASWGGSNISFSSVVGPNNASTASLLTAVLSGQSTHITTTFTATPSQWTCHGWVRAGTASTLDFGIYQGGFASASPSILSGPGSVSGTALATISGMTSAWTHIKLTTTGNLTANPTSIYLYPKNSSGAQVSAGDSAAVAMWNCHAGTIALPYFKTDASALPVAATVASGAHGLTNGSQWCVSAIATPEGRAWALPNASPTSGLEVLWATGAADTANSVRVAAFTDGKLYFKVIDPAGGIKTAAYTHGFAAGSSHRIVACSDNGTLSMAIDGTAISSTITGTGTGVVSSHGTLTVGSATNIQATTGYNGVWNGSIREVVTCNTSNPALCR